MNNAHALFVGSTAITTYEVRAAEGFYVVPHALPTWFSLNANGAAFSTGGKYLACAHSGYLSPFNSTFSVLDLDTLTRAVGIPTISDGASWSAAWSPNNALLAIGHSNGDRYKVFDTSNVDPAQWVTIFGLPAAGGIVYHTQFNPAGTRLALAVSVTDAPLIVLDTGTWVAITLPALTGAGRAVAWSPDGTKLAVATLNSLHILNVSDWTLDQTITTSVGNIQWGALSWSPDGTKLTVAGNTNPRLRTYNTTDWSLIAAAPENSAFTDIVYACAYSPDSQYLAVGNNVTPFLRVYRTSDWSLVPDLIAPASVRSFAWSDVEVLRKVAGVVRDGAGALASRRVMLADRSDGTFLVSTQSSATTGQYVIGILLDSKECDRIVVHDDTAEGVMRNDLIDRVIPA